MQWLEAKVTYTAPNISLAAEQVAGIFYTLGAKGVVVDDPDLGAGEDWGDDAVPPPEKPAVTAYLPVDDAIGHQCIHLNDRLAAMAYNSDFEYNISYNRVDEEDWAESWKAFFHPEKISERIVVKPSWEDYTPAPEELVVEIDPGMAFGTGTHPTTSLCVRLLEKHCRPGCSLLDVGTGSGILMAAAFKLGAARLRGVDNDPVAVDIARDNLLRNNVPEAVVELHTGHLADNVTGTYDVVSANILADVIIDLMDAVPALLVGGGCFICSGIIEAYREKVINKMEACGLVAEETLTEGDWVAIAGRKKA